jgi:DNA modification methylase
MSWEVLNADSRDLPLDDDSVDLIVTSPPYLPIGIGPASVVLWLHKQTSHISQGSLMAKGMSVSNGRNPVQTL